MVLGISGIPADRVFIHNHMEVDVTPSKALSSLTEFLDVNSVGFQKAAGIIRGDVPAIARDLRAEYDNIESQIGIPDWMAQIATVETQ